MTGGGIGRYLPAVQVVAALAAFAAVQVLLFPVERTAVGPRTVAEVSVLLGLLAGVVYLHHRDIRGALSGGEGESVYLPVLAGVTLVSTHMVTDALGGHLARPPWFSVVFGEIALVGGGVALLVALLRHQRVRDRQETVLRARERELAERNERLEEFASVVSHDLRNPLQVAVGNLELIDDRDGMEGELLERTREALGRMDDIIDDVLALSRLGGAAADPEPVALADAARDAWETVETDRATLDAAGGGTVRADPGLLRQALENLFRNAVEHAGEGVTVTVGTLDGGFYVADDGPGIPEGERADVFESGYSTDGGTGFGLAIVERIAAVHGWEVTLTDGESGGARFEFRGAGTAA